MGHQNQITLNWRELYQSKEDLAILDAFTVIAVGKGTTVSSKHIIMHSNNPHCMGGGATIWAKKRSSIHIHLIKQFYIINSIIKN